jgi:hypothetical protein
MLTKNTARNLRSMRHHPEVSQYLYEFEPELAKLYQCQAKLDSGQRVILHLWGNAVIFPDRVRAFRPAVLSVVRQLRRENYVVSCAFRGDRYPYAYLSVWSTPPANWLEWLSYQTAILAQERSLCCAHQWRRMLNRIGGSSKSPLRDF